MLSGFEWLIALLAVFAGATVMGTVSFGMGLVVAPVLLLFLAPQSAVVVVNAIIGIVCCFVLAQARRVIKEKRTVIDPTRWQCVITEDLLELVQSGGEDQAVDIILSQLQDDTIPEMCDDLARCKAGGCVKRAALRAAEAVS